MAHGGAADFEALLQRDAVEKPSDTLALAEFGNRVFAARPSTMMQIFSSAVKCLRIWDLDSAEPIEAINSNPELVSASVRCTAAAAKCRERNICATEICQND